MKIGEIVRRVAVDGCGIGPYIKILEIEDGIITGETLETKYTFVIPVKSVTKAEMCALSISRFDFTRAKNGGTLLFHDKTKSWLHVHAKWIENKDVILKLCSEKKHAYYTVENVKVLVHNVYITLDRLLCVE